jgi:hypothetical protein
MLDQIDLLNFVFMLLATVATIFVAYKVRATNRNLLVLAILLASFTFSHGLYHLFDFLGFHFAAVVLFWPLSAVLLLAFGIWYWKVGLA